MKLTTVGIDLAKNVFQVHGTDEHGKVLEEAIATGPDGDILRQPNDSVVAFSMFICILLPPTRYLQSLDGDSRRQGISTFCV